MRTSSSISVLLRQVARDDRQSVELVPTNEHKDVRLPADMIRPDGSLDLNDEVQALIVVKYSRKRGGLTVRSNGWVGHIPLNDRLTLAVDTKVPVANLERIIDRATFPPHAFRVMPAHQRRYADTDERPASLMDVLADGMISILKAIRQEGLLKTYVEREYIGTNPSGRLDPMRNLIRTKLSGRPTAVSSHFERTVDNVSNRILSLAVDRLLEHYRNRSTKTPLRAAGLSDMREWLPRVSRPSRMDIRPEAIGLQIARLPQHHSTYAAALTLAGYLVADLGLSLLGPDAAATAPVALINMDHVFEGYCRNVLRRRADASYLILDGNVQGHLGSQVPLFTEAKVPQAEISTAEPDIVIEHNGSIRMLIDVKYRPASEMPAREVMNQLACYATRFDCNDVMALYPSLPDGRAQPVETVGEIGPLRILRGTIDISRPDLALAEAEFCDAVWALVG